MILGGPKDTITPLWTKGLKALVPPNSFGPPPMGAVGPDFKDRAGCYCQKIVRKGGRGEQQHWHQTSFVECNTLVHHEC